MFLFDFKSFSKLIVFITYWKSQFDQRKWLPSPHFVLKCDELTLELIATCDFALPVTCLLIDVKRQSAGTSDLF